VLALVSVRGSIGYIVLPGCHRDELLEPPLVPAGAAAQDPAGTAAQDLAAWWRPVVVS
jgi:hypothetical protein